MTTLKGNSGLVIGSNANVHGSLNHIYGDREIVAGNNNQVAGTDQAVFGDGNIVTLQNTNGIDPAKTANYIQGQSNVISDRDDENLTVDGDFNTLHISSAPPSWKMTSYDTPLPEMCRSVNPFASVVTAVVSLIPTTI